MSNQRRKDGGVDAPVSLVGLFKDDDDDDDDVNSSSGRQFEQVYEEQSLTIADTTLIIRQYCWHAANANKVWPGTFVLAEFINEHIDMYTGKS
jgi:hypothetical protein